VEEIGVPGENHLLTIWAQINTCNIFTVLDAYTEVNSACHELTSTPTKVRSSRCDGHLLVKGAIVAMIIW
jgi:hypothetical protein